MFSLKSEPQILKTITGSSIKPHFPFITGSELELTNMIYLNIIYLNNARIRIKTQHLFHAKNIQLFVNEIRLNAGQPAN